MSRFLNAVKHPMQSLAEEEGGSQVAEYAIIIAVVSIALVIALRVLSTDSSSSSSSNSNSNSNSNSSSNSSKNSTPSIIATFVTRVGNCLSLTTVTTC